MPRLPVTPWDVRVISRAAAVGALAFVLAWLLTAATDEGDVGWAERAGRTLPLVPVCSALGAWAALAPATARGEILALAALGRSRAQSVAAAVAGGSLVALAASIALMAAHRIDVGGFFPTIARSDAWRWDGHGFVDVVHGLVVGPRGEIEKVTAENGPSEAILERFPSHARAAAAIAVALAGVALPLLLAHAMVARPDRRLARSEARSIFACAAAIAATILLFQAAASRHVPALLGVVPPALLLGLAVQRYRAAP